MSIHIYICVCVCVCVCQQSSTCECLISPSHTYILSLSPLSPLSPLSVYLYLYLSVYLCLYLSYLLTTEDEQFSKDGTYLAVLERVDCKDCLSVFATQSWDMVKVKYAYRCWPWSTCSCISAPPIPLWFLNTGCMSSFEFYWQTRNPLFIFYIYVCAHAYIYSIFRLKLWMLWTSRGPPTVVRLLCGTASWSVVFLCTALMEGV